MPKTRAILRTNLTFGMVNIPVRVIASTTSEKGVSLHWMHVGDGGCGGPVGYLKHCRGCDQDVEQSQIGSGYQHGDKLIEITDIELEGLPTPSKGKIDLVQFVAGDEIPASMYSTLYYLEPEDVGRMPYALLARVLYDRDVLGIGTVTLRSKESLCAIRSDGEGRLMLETLRRPDELKPPPTLDPIGEPAQEMIDMAAMLVERGTKPFNTDLFTDHYQEALTALVAAKIAGQPAPTAPTVAQPPALDLMQQLRASIFQAKEAKSLPDAEPESVPDPQPENVTPIKRQRRQKDEVAF